MSITNIHPHVSVTTNAAKRKTITADEPNVPILFVPFYSDRGPVGIPFKSTGGVKYCYTMSDFLSTYGDNFAFATSGQQLMNAQNWILGGGAILPCRLWSRTSAEQTAFAITTCNFDNNTVHAYNGNIDAEAHGNTTLAADKVDPNFYCAWAAQAGTDSSTKLAVVRAKHPGSHYIGLKVRILHTGVNSFTISVLKSDGRTVLESFPKRTVSTYRSVIKLSDYIGDIYIDSTVRTTLAAAPSTTALEYTMTLGYTNYADNATFELADMKAGLEMLEDDLQVKCDYILDAGYSANVKRLIVQTLFDENKRIAGNIFRDDIIFLMDSYSLNPALNVKPSEVTLPASGDNSLETVGSGESAVDLHYECIGKYDQYLTTEDTFYATSMGEVYVTPTYFLAQMIPYNELHYHPFYPNCGKTLGVIEGAMSLNHNPTKNEKDSNVLDRLNYIEKDKDGMQFFTNMTMATDNTALQKLNNVRSRNIIRNEVASIARYYIGQSTSDATLRTLQNKIENYLNDWVLSKYLEKAIVDVYADEYDDSIVHVELNIKFTGTIEMIPIVINID